MVVLVRKKKIGRFPAAFYVRFPSFLASFFSYRYYAADASTAVAIPLLEAVAASAATAAAAAVV